MTSWICVCIGRLLQRDLFNKRDSLTNILFTLGLPSFDTVMTNAAVFMDRRYDKLHVYGLHVHIAYSYAFTSAFSVFCLILSCTVFLCIFCLSVSLSVLVFLCLCICFYHSTGMYPILCIQFTPRLVIGNVCCFMSLAAWIKTKEPSYRKVSERQQCVYEGP